MFNQKFISQLLFEKYQHGPKVAVTVRDKIPANNVAELFESGQKF